MKKDFLSLAMIVRDSQDTLEACLHSLRPYVDELVIVDNGSTDATLDIAEAYADVVDIFTDCNNPETGLIEDFAMARNRALSLCEGDWMLWADADDVVDNARALGDLARTRPQHAEQVRFLLPYEYDYDDQGRCTRLQYRERLVYPRPAFEWVTPCHESLLTRSGPCVDIPVQGPTVFRHRAKWSKKPRELQRNLRILKRHIDRVGEADPHAIFYLAKEYARFSELGPAERWFRRRVELPGMDEERCSAAMYLCRIYRAWGALQQSVDWGLKAVEMKPWPEPYFELGKTFRAMALAGERSDYNHRRAAHFIQLGLNLENDGLFEQDPLERFLIHAELAPSLEAVGELAGAIESCESGLVGAPDFAPLREQLSRLQERKRRDTVSVAIDELVASGAIGIAQAKVAKAVIADEISATVMGEDEPAPATDRSPTVSEPVRARPLDIVFFLGQGFEQWNPKTLQANGMGGSETMAWELSKRLAALGHRVRLFGYCPTAWEGKFEGVEYRDFSHYQGTACDVLIASRTPEAVDEALRVSATVRLLWVHDIHVGDRLTPERAARFDAVLLLSEWHVDFFAQTYPWLPRAKLLKTRNGIDTERFGLCHTQWGDYEDCPACGLNQDYAEGSRNPLKAIWSSSADRGLLVALEEWGKIRERVPDAELHVFYGFETWEATARMLNDPAQLRLIAHLKRLLRTVPGVHARGRVSGEVLAQEMLSAGVWSYPTHFAETSCISAMEAQAAGLRIVTSPIAALNETVGARGHMLGHDWGSPAYRARFVEAMVDALTWPEQGDRAELQAYARDHFGLAELAEEWSSMLRVMFDDLSERVVPSYEEAV